MYKFGNQKKGISISQRQREVPPQTRRTHHEKRITHRVAPLSSLFLRRFLRNAPRRSSRSESEKQKRSVSVLCQLFHPQTWEKEGTRKNTDRRSPAEMYRVFFFLQGASSLLKSESGKIPRLSRSQPPGRNLTQTDHACMGIRYRREQRHPQVCKAWARGLPACLPLSLPRRRRRLSSPPLFCLLPPLLSHSSCVSDAQIFSERGHTHPRLSCYDQILDRRGWRGNALPPRPLLCPSPNASSAIHFSGLVTLNLEIFSFISQNSTGV